MLGHGHHTVRHKDYPVEPQATGSVGLGSCGTIPLLCTTIAGLLLRDAGFFWLHVYFFICLKNVHNVFCDHIAADVNRRPPEWFGLTGPHGLLWAFQLPTGPHTFHSG